MSERLPYEQHLHQQWTEIPLPDENLAWADMKRRLEEEDDDRFIFWWRPGCGILLLLLVMLGLGWWALKSKEDTVKKALKEVIYTDSLEKKRSISVMDSSILNRKEAGRKVKENRIAPNDQNKIRHAEEFIVKKNRKIGNNPKKAGKDILEKLANEGTKEKTLAAEESDSSYLTVTATSDTAVTDTAATALLKTDSSIADINETEAVKKKKTDRKSFFLSAGLSLQQQLPIAGQKATPYNSLGRKGSLLDYIPSVYVQLNRKDKWFVQAAFKYGAPQYNKEFLYHQVVVPDTGTFPRLATTTSNRLKKSFYHQLPFTFNYFVKPNWSVGGGLQWNRFFGAVSDREIIEHDNISGSDRVLSKGIAVTKSDSAGSFEKSYFQAVLETQYRWKRFSFGGRYTFGLTPYISVTLPNQPERKEKNSNILLFVRYEIWRQ